MRISAGGDDRLAGEDQAGASRGMVFVPFHWGDLFLPGQLAELPDDRAIGRVAKQPELKYCAVHLEKVPAIRTNDEPVAEPIGRAGPARTSHRSVTAKARRETSHE